jgi:hypothetical protein
MLRHALGTSVAAVAVVLAATCTGAPNTSSPPSSSHEAIRPERSAEGVAVWPEVTPSEVSAAAERLSGGADPWRDDPDVTALRFAAEMLSWPTARVLSTRAWPDGAKEVDLDRGDSGPEPGVVTLTLRPLVAGRWWSVVGARSGAAYRLRAFSIRPGETGFLAFDANGAKALGLLFGFGRWVHDESDRVPLSDPILDWPPEQYPQDQPGFLLVRWIDETLQVAAAVALPLAAATTDLRFVGPSGQSLPGIFPRCPDPQGVPTYEEVGSKAAVAAAQAFDQALVRGDLEAASAYLQEAVLPLDLNLWARTSQASGLVIVESASAAADPRGWSALVERACGPEVLDSSWTVVLLDGVEGTSAQGAVYWLMHQAGGWKVWGSA